MTKQHTHKLQGIALVLALASFQASANTPAGQAPVEFPDIERRAWIKEGTFPNIDNLRQMRTGMSKDQLYGLLGNPHFDEGLFGVRQWNYIFNFRTGAGPAYVTCQYQVRFDDQMRSESMHWKEPACADFVAPTRVAAAPPPAPAPVPLPAPIVLPAPEVISLAADGLFRFNGSADKDLLPQGRQELERLARHLRDNFSRIHHVLVVGHTDRLGRDAYNEALSLARANTVRNLFVAQGLNPQLIRTTGMGKRDPVKTDCTGNRATPALVDCLQPNRRVVVEVTGIKR